MKTEILYEDADILVCFKPAGLAVQSGRVSQPDMVSELKNYLAGKRGKEAAGRMQRTTAPVYLGVVHRLDQPVSGILVFAKNAKSAASLSAQASDHRMQKIYRAEVALPETGSGYTGTGPGLPAADGYVELEDTMEKGPDGTARIVPDGTKGAKRARLKYRVLERKQNRALLEIELLTGRYHQIRLQLSHAGLPILGDNRYGTPESRAFSERCGVRGIRLQAVGLCFFHPATGKRVCYELDEKMEFI